MSLTDFILTHDRLSLSEAAALLHTDRERVRALIDAGEVIAVEAKGVVYVTRDSLQRHLAAHGKAVTP